MENLEKNNQEENLLQGGADYVFCTRNFIACVIVTRKTINGCFSENLFTIYYPKIPANLRLANRTYGILPYCKNYKKYVAPSIKGKGKV